MSFSAPSSAGPSSLGLPTHPPAPIPPPTPIPLGALPVLDPSAAPRRMSIPGPYTSAAGPPYPYPYGSAPRPEPAQTQPTLVRLRPTRLRDLPRRLLHPPALPEFMQGADGEDAERDEGRSERGKQKQTASASGSNHERRQIEADMSGSGIAGGKAKGKDRGEPQSVGSPCSESAPGSANPNECPNASMKRKRKARRWNWGITPSFEVKLEDVLNRKHLPPLGLKDFEEWLLFVEGSAENLYFILWLREYKARYTAWTASLKGMMLAHKSASTAAPFALPHPLAAHPNYPYGHTSSSSPSQTHTSHLRPFASLGLAMAALNRSHGSSPASSRSHHSTMGDTNTNASPTTSPNDKHDADVIEEVDVGEGGVEEAEEESDDSEARRRKQRRPRAYRTVAPALPPNPALALFYLRAKETFLTPNAPYELRVGSDVLAVFHTGPASGNTGGVAGAGENSGANSTASTGAYGYMHPWATALGHAGKLPPPPDPAVFAELKDIVEGRLKESLNRLVVATYNNVGMPRAYCGSAGGFAIGLIGSAPPLASSFALGGSRWYRLLALPGMWLGMTIFISAWYGVCMMIYIFGDLRQLRSFELARPSIPPSRPLSDQSSGKHIAPVPITRPPRPLLTIVTPDPPKDGSLPSVSVGGKGTPAAEGSNNSPVNTRSAYEIHEDDEDDEDDDDDEDDEDEYETDDDDEDPQIEISDAFYDEHPSPEGPATAPADWFTTSRPQQPREAGAHPLWPDYERTEDGSANTHTTAAFIGPYVYDGSESDARAGGAADVEKPPSDASACQPLAEFDFDGLPPRKPSTASVPPLSPRMSSFAERRDNTHAGEDERVGRPGSVPSKAQAKAQTEKRGKGARSPSPSGSSMNDSVKARRWWSWWWWSFVERVETMCSPENAVDALEKEDALRMKRGEAHREGPWTISVRQYPPSSSPANSPPASAPQPYRSRPSGGWREGLKRVYLAVPAFASPLTPVLNPLVGRAQWEIVVRSAAMALFLSCVVVGSLLAVPE